MKLYCYSRSSASRRVRIALALKRVEYEPIDVDLARGAQNEATFAKIHPQGLVPVLVTSDGSVLTQSIAIAMWLDESYGKPVLFGRNHADRAAIMELVNIIACDVHALQGQRLARWLSDAGASAEIFSVVARRAIESGLNACETHLRRRASTPFACGTAPTAADVWLVPQLANARHYGVPLATFDRLLEIEAACLEMDEFRVALTTSA